MCWEMLTKPLVWVADDKQVFTLVTALSGYLGCCVEKDSEVLSGLRRGDAVLSVEFCPGRRRTGRCAGH